MPQVIKSQEINRHPLHRDICMQEILITVNSILMEEPIWPIQPKTTYYRINLEILFIWLFVRIMERGKRYWKSGSTWFSCLHPVSKQTIVLWRFSYALNTNERAYPVRSIKSHVVNYQSWGIMPLVKIIGFLYFNAQLIYFDVRGSKLH